MRAGENEVLRALRTHARGDGDWAEVSSHDAFGDNLIRGMLPQTFYDYLQTLERVRGVYERIDDDRGKVKMSPTGERAV